MIYCYEKRFGLRKHSSKEVLYISDSKLEISKCPLKEDETYMHYYAAYERGVTDKDVVVWSDSLGSYISECEKGIYTVGIRKSNLTAERVHVVTSLEDVESFFSRKAVNPKDHEDFFLQYLDREDPALIREYYPEAVYIVTRSYRPGEKIPWKRIGFRSYLWLVYLENRDTDKGRRIEWGNDVKLYTSRKKALKALYQLSLKQPQ